MPTASGFVLIREATEDTVLQIPNPPGVGGNTVLPVQKGVQVVVDMIGVRKYRCYDSCLTLISSDRVQSPLFRRTREIQALKMVWLVERVRSLLRI